jgi:hypothetical protein
MPRRAAIKAGAPVIPGTTDALKDFEAARAARCSVGLSGDVERLPAAAVKACDKLPAKRTAISFEAAQSKRRRPLEIRSLSRESG